MTGEQLWGHQTELAISNFPISGRRIDARIITALAQVKKAAAGVNARHDIIDQELLEAIASAADEVIAGRHADQFPVDVFQTGSGTSTNMNVNEVIASIASASLGRAVHPNDDVNASQSSNDVFPTALHLAAAHAITHELLPAVETLADTFEHRATEFADAVKPGRTHLMDAVPVTLGQEFGGYAAQLRSSLEHIAATMPRLCEVPLGGTAVGNGLNTPAGYRASVVQELAALTKLPLTPARNGFEAQAARDGLVATSGALRGLAVALTKIVNDLRWMNSGPRTGLHEIALPNLQAGSSIMPGKVNPVIPEAVAQVCAHVIGLDASIAWGGAAGSFELNTMMPMMGTNLLDEITLLASACAVLESKAVRGLTADTTYLAVMAAASPAVITALNTTIGYERAAAIVKEADLEGVSIVEAVAARVAAGELPADALEAIDPIRLAHP